MFMVHPLSLYFCTFYTCLSYCKTRMALLNLMLWILNINFKVNLHFTHICIQRKRKLKKKDIIEHAKLELNKKETAQGIFFCVT